MLKLYNLDFGGYVGALSHNVFNFYISILYSIHLNISKMAHSLRRRIIFKDTVKWKILLTELKFLKFIEYLYLYYYTWQVASQSTYDFCYCFTYHVIAKGVLSSRNTLETDGISAQRILGIRGCQLHENSYSPDAVSSANYIFTNTNLWGKYLEPTSSSMWRINAKDSEIPLANAYLAFVICRLLWTISLLKRRIYQISIVETGSVYVLHIFEF